MANEFESVTYDETQVGTTDALNAPTGELDLNDPKFAAEDIGVNPEGDAYATPPPPPDNDYRAKLKQLDVEFPKGSGNFKRFAPWQKGDKVALFTKIEATIQDPTGKYDNIKVFDSWFSTYLNRDGSTKVSTLLRALGVQIPARASHAILMESLVKALAAEPDVIITTQWEASCAACAEEAKKTDSKRPRSINGMRKFPLLAGKTNEYNPEIICPADSKHGLMTAQVRIAGFKSVK